MFRHLLAALAIIGTASAWAQATPAERAQPAQPGSTDPAQPATPAQAAPPVAGDKTAPAEQMDCKGGASASTMSADERRRMADNCAKTHPDATGKGRTPDRDKR